MGIEDGIRNEGQDEFPIEEKDLVEQEKKMPASLRKSLIKSHNLREDATDEEINEAVRKSTEEMGLK